MTKWLRVAARIVVLGGVFSARSEATVFVECLPSLSDVSGNEVVQFDCSMISDTALTLNTYRLAFPCAAGVGPGATGSIDHFTVAATECTFLGEDAACNFNGFQGDCGGSSICTSPAQCGGAQCLQDPNNQLVKYCENSGDCVAPSPSIDITNTTFVFRGTSNFTLTVGIGTCPGVSPFIQGSFPPGQGAVVAVGELKYLGAFLYRSSECSGGSFTFNAVGAGFPPGLSDQTRMVSISGSAVAVSGSPSGISVDTGLCCGTSGCLGNFNSYCCRNVQPGLLSKPDFTCGPPTPGTCICTTDAQCDDFDACTDDTCAPGTPLANSVGCISVSNVPPGYCCDPTGIGPLDPLDDGSACTLDSCVGGVYPAAHDGVPMNGNSCPDDGNECTVNYCQNGLCISDSAQANGTTCTADSNICTADTCQNGTCIASAAGANGLPCGGDGIYCTLDACLNGSCTHTAIGTFPCEQLSDCPANANGCSGTIGNPGSCQCSTPPGGCWGDIVPPGGNAICDLDDLLCLLDGFSNFALCPLADLMECGGNGVVDLDDLIAILDAFSGMAGCLPACG